MSRGNLSAWALAHRPLVLFFLLASVLAGALSYQRLGRAEDPPFTFKVMTVSAYWPGATAREMELLVADRIEKALEGLPWFDLVRSYSKPGATMVFVQLADSTPPKEVKGLWYQARKRVGDVAQTLPDGTIGPFFNDEFGDVYSSVYAVVGEEFGFAELKRAADDMRARLLRVPGVRKVDLIGSQAERIYVEISSQRLASFGLTVQAVMEALQRDNAVTAAGSVDTASDKVFVRVDMGLDTVARVSALPVGSGGRLITIGDVADVSRGYVDPPTYLMRAQGRAAVGLGVVMADGRNVLKLGDDLGRAMEGIRADLPVGMEALQIADQSHVVTNSISEFVKALLEALGIVMAVSFLSLGWRTGTVVALTVPLVLAMVASTMLLLGIDLHRISLGALIIALGLLVDDAIIAVEMMHVKMEQGWDRLKAGAFAYTSTAFPMLSGTIVTAVGFVPVGFAQSAAGEYTNAIFWVVGASLLLSWIAAVIFTPYLGYMLLPDPKHGAESHGGGHGGGHDAHDVYDSRPYRIFRAMVTACVRWRWVSIAVTVMLFIASVAGFGLVQQQFFPASARPELLVDVRLAEGSAIAATDRAVRRLEKIVGASEDVEHWATYVGGGSPRFYLPLDQQLQNDNFGQLVVVTKGLESRERLIGYLESLAESEFPEARVRVSRLENGPPVGYPVQFRVTGPDPAQIRRTAEEVRKVMAADPNLANLHLDWNELAKRVRLEVDVAKARALGVTRQDLSNALQLLLGGVSATQYREGVELVDVVLRTSDAERLDLGRLDELTVPTGRGVPAPLSQVATLRYEFEEPILWRRNRETVMTVKGDVVGGLQAPVVSQRVDKALSELKAKLPDGYRIAMGGAIEESAKGQTSIAAMVPLMILLMAVTLMVQLQSFSRVFLVFLTAPLGLIGVTAALLLTGMPFGFVATLGVIALAGIIMRNSVILVDQIDQDIHAGHSPWEAIIGATVRRARPIALTAAAAILAMIPLTRNVFWGPMAVSMMGGLAVATLLTLFFLPALYAAWFKVREG
ncbi:MAG TPA: efflux RND transporter permease subunit [Azospirillaceae bacterium]|nr:efflux RND transporter permease subunit [Azospirillaceae bacterium]HRQ79511.1 efflux RND transporter permease subunit [Azospirillaceae bacterium]